MPVEAVLLPEWLGGAPVSLLAYRVVCVGFGDPPVAPFAAIRITPTIARASLVDVINHVTGVLEEEEANVLRAFYELQLAGVFEVVEG
jgi:hypothetical protein